MIPVALETGHISIHALREEGDPDDQAVGLAPFQFLSTPSARRATPVMSREHCQLCISIHALREEGDVKLAVLFTRKIKPFLSTPSARRATPAW